MKGGVPAAVAFGVGCVLGRRRKMRLATMLALGRPREEWHLEQIHHRIDRAGRLRGVWLAEGRRPDGPPGIIQCRHLGRRWPRHSP